MSDALAHALGAAGAAPGIQVARRIEDGIASAVLERGMLTAEKIAAARRRARMRELSLVEVLELEAEVDREMLLAVLAEVHGVPAVDFREVLGDPLVLSLLPRDLAFELGAVPLFLVGGRLTTAMSGPENPGRIDRIRLVTGQEIVPVVALPGELRRHLAQAYGRGDVDLLEPVELDGEAGNESEQGERTVGSEEAVEEEQTQRLIQLVLGRALQDGASAVHLEPREQCVEVRLRVDGRLVRLPYEVPIEAATGLSTRLKTLARMSSASSEAQTGSLRLLYRGTPRIVELATLLTRHGERLTLRFEQPPARDVVLGELDLAPKVFSGWRNLLRSTSGLLLIAGPPQSGRSTTLSATLRELDRVDLHVAAVRGVEGSMVAGVTYSQGLLDDEASELSPEGLQSLLRQDPDVLVLEELDSKASVVQALRLARGGMLVLATVQAADAASAVRRLLDLGVAPGSLAAALVGVLAQRRIRRCCQHCAATGPVDREMVRREPLAVARGHVARQPAGCPACSGRGYEGSLRIHELAVVNEGVSRVIAASGTLAELAHEMCAGGLAPLWRDGLDKVARGETALRELVREVELPYAQEAQRFPRRAKRGAERAPSDAPAEAS